MPLQIENLMYEFRFSNIFKNNLAQNHWCQCGVIQKPPPLFFKLEGSCTTIQACLRE